MITISAGHAVLTMPTAWDELAPADGRKFVSLCKALSDFEEGRIDFDQMRVLAVTALMGVRLGAMDPAAGHASETIYRLIPYTDFLYVVRDSRASVRPVLCEQLLPELGGLRGYRFSLQGGVALDCDITAEQYVDAVSLMQAFSATSDRAILRRLVATLYCPKPYDAQLAAALDFEATEEEQLAVYYNFRGILEWVRALPTYDLIFRRPSGESPRDGSPLGMAGSIFAIAKAGYGDISSIRRLDMFSYLGVLVQMTVDSVRSLASARMKPGEIADRLQLEMDQVLRITSEGA